MSLVLSGKAPAEAIRQRTVQLVHRLKKAGVHPKMAIVDATGDRSSAAYARIKIKKAAELGISTSFYGIDPLSKGSTSAFLELIHLLGHDNSVHSIFIERPLPTDLNTLDCASVLPPIKDIEGMHPANLGKLFLGIPGLEPAFTPTTAAACMEMLRYYRIHISGKRAVMVGRSAAVGKPLAWLLLNADATVTICHTKTANLSDITRQADILAVAVGHPKMIKGSMISPDAVILDIGTNYTADGQVVGDVDIADCIKASAITPAVGGIGPITTALLLENAARAAAFQARMIP